MDGPSLSGRRHDDIVHSRLDDSDVYVIRSPAGSYPISVPFLLPIRRSYIVSEVGGPLGRSFTITRPLLIPAPLRRVHLSFGEVRLVARRKWFLNREVRSDDGRLVAFNVGGSVTVDGSANLEEATAAAWLARAALTWHVSWIERILLRVFGTILDGL